MADRPWPTISAGSRLRWEQQTTVTDASMKVGEKRRTSMHIDSVNLDVPGTLTRTATGFTFTPDKRAHEHETGEKLPRRPLRKR